jgi:cell division protein FtsQ
MAVLGAIGASFAVIAVMHSSLFAARHLVVDGNRHTPSAAVLAASGLAKEPPLINVNTSAVAERVEALPWVKGATVSRHWPQTVQIILTERVPVAYATDHGQVALLDVTGRVLTDLPASAAATEGLAPLGDLVTPLPGRRLAPREAGLLAVAGALPEASLSQVTVLEQNSSFGVEAQLRDGAMVIFGSSGELSEKMIALATLLQDKVLTAKVRADLRVPAAPVLTG